MITYSTARNKMDPNMRKRTFKVRPLQGNNAKMAFNVNMSAAALMAIRMKSGDLCEIQHASTREDGAILKTPAVAWTTLGKVGDNVAQISSVLKDHCGLSYGQDIEVSKLDGSLEEVDELRLLDLSAGRLPPVEDIVRDEPHTYVGNLLQATNDIVVTGQKISLRIIEPRTFVVMRSGMPDSGIAKLSRGLKVYITRDAEEPIVPSASLTVGASGLGGLNAQVDRIQSIIDRLTAKSLVQLPPFYRPSQGVLFYGAKGTGKTALIEKIAESPWAAVIHWSKNQEMPKITKLPVLIVISDVDNEQDNRQEQSSASIAPYKKLFDLVRERPVLVVAESRHPNNINASLRAPAYFSSEIELPVPTASHRAEILRAICQHSDQPSDTSIDSMAQKTHGYVGADLYALLQSATDIALHRVEAKAAAINEDVIDMNGLSLDTRIDDNADPPAYTEVHHPEAQLQITLDDLTRALAQVRPTALQEVFLETPNIRWSDIGGQHDIKRRLKNAIERPLRQADLMKQLNLRPKKGVLLYGPPGCSKTLMVKALATEAELNFLAVKGAELISMYVGESERAIREVFRKARAASPSIIFFDEIDSIASNRKSELNVLTTLLNEMDGFEELRNVLVVAATNKPQQIDPALMRPGRLDDIVYVGPPDEETRKEILQNWFAKSRVVDVEPGDLAGASTEGFSGAELTSICQTAGEYAMDAGRNHIVLEDFTRAIVDTPRGITKDMLEEYKKWHESRK
jgi:AAA family ATPase